MSFWAFSPYLNHFAKLQLQLISFDFLFLELLSEDDVAESLQQYLGIKPPRPMLQIVKVEFQASQHLLHRIRIAIIEGGIGCNSRPDLIEILVSRIMFHDLVDIELPLRSWSDESHIPFEHIPQLRKLVEVMSPKESSHFRKSRVALYFQ